LTVAVRPSVVIPAKRLEAPHHPREAPAIPAKLLVIPAKAGIKSRPGPRFREDPDKDRGPRIS
jgi:hypothetical protein